MSETPSVCARQMRGLRHTVRARTKDKMNTCRLYTYIGIFSETHMPTDPIRTTACS
jgi:hypothetical protein